MKELSPRTVMLLLNTVYFKGEWLYAFNTTDIIKLSFYNFNIKEEVEIETMTYETSLKYYEDSDIEVVELSYKKDHMKIRLIYQKKTMILINILILINLIMINIKKLKII